MSTPKRKHNTLSIKDKITIIERVEHGENYNKLAEEYSVGRATIYGIHKNREKIQEYASGSECSLEGRLTLKKAKHPEVEEALHMWYLKEKDHMLITGPLLASKAKYFYEQMTGKSDFTASKGWRDRFKLRYGIKLNIGENNWNDTCTEEIKEKFLHRVAELNLRPSQVYNATVSGLFWKVPNKIHEDKASDDQVVDKERFAIFPCSNASGQHSLKLLIIGRRPKTRTIRNIELPVHYYRQKYTTLTRELVKKWFDECFVPEVRKWLQQQDLPQKALLILSNTDNLFEDELSTDDKSIVTMLLPANSIEIQPMDQISQCVKKDYKKKMLADVLNDKALVKIIKKFNMKYMVFSLYESWRDLHVSKIFAAWEFFWEDTKLNHPQPESEDYSDRSSTPELLEKVAIKTQVSNEELQQWYDGVDEQVNSISEEEIISDYFPKEEDRISAEDAIKSFDTCLQWAEENDFSNEEIILLQRMKQKAFQKLKGQNDDDYILPDPNDYLKVHLDD